MNKAWRAGWLAALLLLSSGAVLAQQNNIGGVEVEVISDRGSPLPRYPLRRDSGRSVYKAYVEAKRGENYSIQVRNRTDQRVGVVIAVDGRNIISGDRSNLRPNERMYVLAPNQTESYEGWRTGKNKVNRFYFTEAGDSYAAAWGDRSAMGVIAVAAFREIPPYRPQPQPWSQDSAGRSGQPELRKMPSAAPPAARQSEPGTGYGETEWSPSKRVEFDPETRPFAQFFLKYSWRETLCQQRVIECEGSRRPRNRLWNEEEDFAPPPPRQDGREEWR
jgi:hypothetical protein